MKKILAFAGSNSKTSINKQLATYAASLVGNAEVNVVDLNDYPLPLYGIDLENVSGIPENAQVFLDFIHTTKAQNIIAEYGYLMSNRLNTEQGI